MSDAERGFIHVRNVAAFTVDDPGRDLAQPHRGAADAPIFSREGISDAAPILGNEIK
jgi:hypothetical protein